MNDITDSYNVTAEADQAHDDQWLAYKVASLGVGKLYGPTETQSGGYAVPRDGTEKLYVYSAEQFVRDPRVAMALLSKMSCMQISEACKQSDGLLYHGWLKRPRAIVEKCVEVLGG